MTAIVCAIIFGSIAAACFVFGGLQLCQKGPLLNNAYLYASENERERMNKKLYYRQSGIVFLLLSIVFALNAVQAITANSRWFLAVGIVIAVTVVYAIWSSVVIAKKQ